MKRLQLALLTICTLLAGMLLSCYALAAEPTDSEDTAPATATSPAADSAPTDESQPAEGSNAVTLGDARSQLGDPMTDADIAHLDNQIGQTREQFEKPLNVYGGEAQLDLGGKTYPAYVLFYVRDGAIRGYLFDVHSDDFANVSAKDQRAIWNAVCADLSGYEVSEEIYPRSQDVKGGGWSFTDNNGGFFMAEWEAGSYLQVVIDDAEFAKEHMIAIQKGNGVDGSSGSGDQPAPQQ